MTRVAAAAPVTALLDREGRILRADDALMTLQIEAGGEPHGPLALPALAALVRLALRLGTPLSRSVELAREEADISLWAQLRPEGEWLHVSLLDWQERRPRESFSRAGALQGLLDPSFGRGWEWQVDDQMRFCRPDVSAAKLGHAAPGDGQTFTAFFALMDDPSGAQRGMPMIEALVRHMNFEGQLARLRGDDNVRYRLSGTALFEADGTFAGYRGRAVREEMASPAGQPSAHAAARVPVAPPVAEPPVDAQRPATAAASSAGVRVPPVDLFGPALSRRLDSALRQPISRIIANAGTISDRVNGPLRQDYVNYATDIASAGRHLLALVDDLADLQAIEGPGFKPVSEEVDLSEIARRAAGLLNIRADARRITIEAPRPDERVFARAEYRRVLQILVNLVGNAVRHSPEQSTIWIRLDEIDGRARVVVADQGNGVDASDHHRIFERFERLGNTDGEGSGLGLYISRQLARAMGGDIMIDSALGSGARFTLDLPAWRAVSQADFKAG